MSITYATWNSADKGANIVLSGGDLTASKSNAGWQSVRATIGVSSGKWYWETTVGGSTIDVLTGVGNISMPLTSWVGNDANGWGYYFGAVKYNSSSSAYGATYAVGDIIGVALDMDAGTIEMYKNNVSQGTMYTGLTGTLYPAVSIDNATINWTANFGATTMAYTAPSGYNQGLFTGSLMPGFATTNMVVSTS